jgi:hypothetical protein
MQHLDTSEIRAHDSDSCIEDLHVQSIAIFGMNQLCADFLKLLRGILLEREAVLAFAQRCLSLSRLLSQFLLMD